MATFVMPKSVDDIQEPILLPEDWYVCRITKEPTLEDNRTAALLKKGEMSPDDPKAAKAGKNIVVSLATVSDIPEYNGRMFTLWLPYPGPGDDSRYDGRGQSYEDSKIARIAEYCKAFSGRGDGSDMNFAEGMQAQVYVIQQLNLSGTKMTNSINLFAGAKAVESEDSAVDPFA